MMTFEITAQFISFLGLKLKAEFKGNMYRILTI